MALEYTLELASKLGRSEVAQALIRLGFTFDTQVERLIAPGVTVVVAEESDLGRSIMKDAYRLEPSVYAKFRLDKFDGWSSGLEKTLTAALELLRNTGGSGILLFNGETPVLLSKEGQLTLNNGNDFWEDPTRLALVTSPYEMRTLPSL